MKICAEKKTKAIFKNYLLMGILTPGNRLNHGWWKQIKLDSV